MVMSIRRISLFFSVFYLGLAPNVMAQLHPFIIGRRCRTPCIVPILYKLKIKVRLRLICRNGTTTCASANSYSEPGDKCDCCSNRTKAPINPPFTCPPAPLPTYRPSRRPTKFSSIPPTRAPTNSTQPNATCPRRWYNCTEPTLCNIPGSPLPPPGYGFLPQCLCGVQYVKNKTSRFVQATATCWQNMNCSHMSNLKSCFSDADCNNTPNVSSFFTQCVHDSGCCGRNRNTSYCAAPCFHPGPSYPANSTEPPQPVPTIPIPVPVPAPVPTNRTYPPTNSTQTNTGKPYNCSKPLFCDDGLEHSIAPIFLHQCLYDVENVMDPKTGAIISEPKCWQNMHCNATKTLKECHSDLDCQQPDLPRYFTPCVQGFKCCGNNKSYCVKPCVFPGPSYPGIMPSLVQPCFPSAAGWC
jgi:hypothetical protein